MKIKKIKSIKNVGSFKEYEWDKFNKFHTKEKLADGTKVEKIGEFGKKNLLYGDNGNGKSTIVKIFKSINNTTVSLSKNWDALGDEQNVTVIMSDDGENIFDGTSWNIGLPGKIHIFDKEFIRNSVGDLHEEIEIEISKKRGEHFFTLGEFKEKEQFLGELKNEKIEINTILGTGKDIMNLYSQVAAIKEESVREEKKIELESKLKVEKQKGLDAKKRKENLVAIQKLKIPSEINLDPTDFFNESKVFSQKLSSLIFSYGEETLVKDIVSIIHKHSAEECLVCKQSIKTSENTYMPRMQELMDNILVSSVEEIEKQMNSQLLNIENFLKSIQQLPEILTIVKKDHGDLIEILNGYGVNVSKYSNISELDFSLDVEEKSIIQSLLHLVSEKQKSKSKAIEFNPESIGPTLKRMQETLDLLNKKFQDDEILLKDIQAQSITSIQTEIDTIEGEEQKINLELILIGNYTKIASFIGLCKAFYDGEKSITDGNFDLKNCLEKLRSIINKKFNEFVKKYGENIGKHISDINSSISVAFDCNLDGGISNGASRCGFSLMYNGTDIARELSEGEKRVVALGYFFALRGEEMNEYETVKLEIGKMEETLKDATISSHVRMEIVSAKFAAISHLKFLQEKILVFDDPVTDFDAGHKQKIAIKFHEISGFYSQSFIFTHDEKFKEYLEKSGDMGGGLFAIQKIHIGSVIGSLGKNQTQLYEDDLRSFYIDGTVGSGEYFRIRENVYKLRFCLENWIKNEGLLWGVEKFDSLLDGLSTIARWTPEQIQTLREIYKFCNLNGSHEGSCEGYNGLKKNIEHYFQLKRIPLVPAETIPNGETPVPSETPVPITITKSI